MVRFKWITLTAKYPGRCLVDGGPIRVGEKVEWCKGIGARHISCGKKADQVEELKKKCFESVFKEDFDSAAKFAGEALDIEPNEKEILNLAQSVYDTWDFSGAIKLYDKVLKKNPNHFDALMGKAAALRFIGEHNQAIRCYNKILKKEPTNLFVLMAKVDTYIFGIRDARKAIQILKNILRFTSQKTVIGTQSLSPGAIQLFSRCSDRFARCGEYEEAIKTNEKLLSRNPDNTDARFAKLNWLVELMMEQRSERDALKIINKYLKNDPKFFVYQLKHNFYLRAGKIESALDVYKIVLKEEPETDFDVLIKANALLEAGDNKATRKFCEENLHRDGIASHLRYKIGLTYQRQGMLPKALDIFQELDLKNSEEGITDTIMLRNVSRIYEDLGQDEDVLTVSMQILQTEGDDKEILVKVIHLLKKRRQTDELINWLRRLHKLHPNSNNFTMAYANALMEKNEIKKAAELYTSIVETHDLSDETDDDAKYASLKLAECMFKLGEKKLAYKIFLELVKDDKKFKEAWAGLAKVATELGKMSEAKRAIEKAANLEKYEISRDTIGSEHVEEPFISTTYSQSPERSLSKGQNVVQKPTFRYNPKTRMADKGVEKTFVDNIDSLLNVNGGTLQIGFTDGKPTGLFNDLKLFPKKKRNHEEFEKKLREILQKRLSVFNILRDIRITFPKTHSVYVCEMFIPKSSIPIWVVTKNKDEEFYVRQKKELVRLSPREQKEYIDDNFGDIE